MPRKPRKRNIRVGEKFDPTIHRERRRRAPDFSGYIGSTKPIFAVSNRRVRRTNVEDGLSVRYNAGELDKGKWQGPGHSSNRLWLFDDRRRLSHQYPIRRSKKPAKTTKKK